MSVSGLICLGLIYLHSQEIRWWVKQDYLSALTDSHTTVFCLEPPPPQVHLQNGLLDFNCEPEKWFYFSDVK